MNTLTQTHPKAVRWLLLLVALTAIVSLLYGIQYYLGGPLRLTVTSEVYDLALSPDGSTVAAAASDGVVRLWDVGSNWTLRELAGHTGAVLRVAFDSSGSTLFSAGRDGVIRLWDVASGQVETELKVPEEE